MTISEMLRTFTLDQLQGSSGDRDPRYRAFRPLFDDLFENKIVFQSRIVVVLRLPVAITL
ncbi:MAG: hypothetical protein AB9869_09805 [Verrucomicrobiia bacterium]